MMTEEVRQDFASQPMDAPPPSDLGRLQSTLASCYFHSGMPALVRRVRERYHLNISPDACAFRKWQRNLRRWSRRSYA